MDTNNILRVDLYDCYRYAERVSVYRAQGMGLDPDIFAISEDDYPNLHDFVMEGASKIADKANYIQDACETGLDALTAGCCDPCMESRDLECVPEEYKLAGESMDPDRKPFIIFNIQELDGVTLHRNTIIQSYIQEALAFYILMKWYNMNGRMDLSALDEVTFNSAVDKVRFNSIVNKKRKSVKRPYRPFG